MSANKMRKHVWGIHLASDLQIVRLESFKDKWKMFKEKFKVKNRKKDKRTFTCGINF